MSLGQLLGINKVVDAEIYSLCFRKWEIQFCIDHSYEKHWPDQDMHSLLRPWLTENYSRDKEFFWRPPVPLRRWLRVIPNVSLKIFYSSIENRQYLLWEHKSHRWTIIDSTRSLVLFLNETEQTKELLVDMRFENYDKEEKDEQEELARYLGVFKALSEAVSLSISFDVDKPLKRFTKFLERLQSANRTTYFPIRKHLFPTWYRLRNWAEYAFVFWKEDNDWEDGWRDMWFTMNDKKDDLEIQDLLEDGWDAHNAGDDMALLKVKEDLGAIWKRQQQDCKKQWDDIWDDEDS